MTLIIARGHGPFPLDMLRYDRCTPRTSDDVKTVEQSIRGGWHNRPWEVELVTERKSATVDRWASFGCAIKVASA